ncbi:hypothetical protein J4E90_009729 [Alternaria incomplexa]|uniref:uncharacterized protein n=1 Tax=Alternaria incomplexa TaxID=1187928 RepID=UPI00221E47D2|nr:uncharacterized protein J4E90_009729 [Alternaria incomplexa]KAI4907227.1 hypothetical protein J4E90_009729 [Alternaria incomplexa]
MKTLSIINDSLTCLVDDIGVFESYARSLIGQKADIPRGEVRGGQFGRTCSERIMELMKVDVIAVYQDVDEKADKEIDCGKLVLRKFQVCIVA